MLKFRFYTLFFLFSSLCSMQIIQPMHNGDVDALAGDLGALNLQDTYYSDSEDEAGYTYPGIPPLVIGEEKLGKECTPLVRGIHFSPSKFDREEISPR